MSRIIGKTMEQFMDEYANCLVDKTYSKKLKPMTLEGSVVRISDIIAYIGRDIEDAIVVKLIKREDIPEDVANVLGRTNSEIIDALVIDLVMHSYGKPYLEFSKEVFNALKKLLDFNYKNIYANPLKEDKVEKFEEMFASVYRGCKKELSDKNSYINKIYLANMNKSYTKVTSSDKMVVDFIAGMTDEFFVNEYRRMYLPRTFGLTV